MFIPRELGMHSCEKCKGSLIDNDFYECGVSLQGDDKWKVFFKYGCRHCNEGKPIGAYWLAPDDDELPGEMFRQLADAIDITFLAEAELSDQS